MKKSFLSLVLLMFAMPINADTKITLSELHGIIGV